jgi:hypothetical protein
MAKKNIHIVKGKEGWDVKRENAKKATKNFDKKEDAQKYAEKLGKKDKVEVIPHKEDGKFQKSGRSSYGNDDCPPEG